MESQPQNSEFRNNPENFHPCFMCFSFYQNFTASSRNSVDPDQLMKPADQEPNFSNESILTICIQESLKQAHFTNSDNPDEMPHNVAFHQGLYCLLQ